MYYFQVNIYIYFETSKIAGCCTGIMIMNYDNVRDIYMINSY